VGNWKSCALYQDLDASPNRASSSSGGGKHACRTHNVFNSIPSSPRCSIPTSNASYKMHRIEPSCVALINSQHNPTTTTTQSPLDDSRQWQSAPPIQILHDYWFVWRSLPALDRRIGEIDCYCHGLMLIRCYPPASVVQQPGYLEMYINTS
jgi:hypothetical protein